MKRFAQIASTLVVAASVFGGVAAADTTCNGSINTTGTNSQNSVNCVDNNNNSVSCTNNVVVSNNNSQSANSGSATTSGNTTSGSATSGNAGNSNTSNTTVTVGSNCMPASNGTFTVTPPTTGGRGGEVAGDQVAVKPAGAVAAGGGAGAVKNQVGLLSGIAASLAAIGVGLSLRKRFQA